MIRKGQASELSERQTKILVLEQKVERQLIHVLEAREQWMRNLECGL